MEQFRLEFDKRISNLEKENRWKTVIDIVWKQWKENPDKLNCLLCAGTQLWYTILVMEDVKEGIMLHKNVEVVDEFTLQSKLMDITQYGFENFQNNSIFNAYFGYMISVMPYFFLEYNGDYDGWQKKGIEMMHKSYRLDPYNPFCEAMHYEKGDYGEGTPYFKACKKIWFDITPHQWGDSAVQQYFFRILFGGYFYPDAYSE